MEWACLRWPTENPAHYTPSSLTPTDCFRRPLPVGRPLTEAGHSQSPLPTPRSPQKHWAQACVDLIRGLPQDFPAEAEKGFSSSANETKARGNGSQVAETAGLREEKQPTKESFLTTLS